METNLKDMVREKYSAIANQSSDVNAASCCGATACCGSTDGYEGYTIMSDDYTKLEGYAADADLGLGCGLPTQFAKIAKGNTVIDLGSGAGNDCFVARAATGEQGKVIGIDFTEAMISRARVNAEKLGYNNVEFRQGDIEDMPVGGKVADVVVSNCVLNLVPNKENVFKEIYRVLKPGGHFSISDIVLQGALPAKWKEVAELYAGCISGAIQKSEYLDIIDKTGFADISLQKEKEIIIPESILSQYLTAEETEAYLKGSVKIVSITVFAKRPLQDKSCCEPGSGCC